MSSLPPIAVLDPARGGSGSSDMPRDHSVDCCLGEERGLSTKGALPGAVAGVVPPPAAPVGSSQRVRRRRPALPDGFRWDLRGGPVESQRVIGDPVLQLQEAIPTEVEGPELDHPIGTPVGSYKVT